MMKTQSDRALIREFLDLVSNERYDLRKYSRPVLVYTVDDGYVKYSLWEDDLLKRFGIQHVDGWDFKEDLVFCPDWITEDEESEEDLDDDLDDDDDNFDFSKYDRDDDDDKDY